MKRCCLLVLSIVVWGVMVYAQKVEYAGHVIDISSDQGGKQFSLERVLGKPNAMPQGGSSPCAWAPENADSHYEFVEVGFEEPMQIRQVAVFENFNPGAIQRIYLIDKQQKKHPVYQGNAGPVDEESRVFHQIFPLTEYEVEAVRVELDASAVPGSNQIDAIAISDSEEPIEAKINVVPDLKFEARPENLGESVNSEYSEKMPVISPDGKTLYFVRKDHPMNIDMDLQVNDDIWVSYKDDDGNWSEAKNLGYPLNNYNHNFLSSVKPDGNTVLLGNQYFKDMSSAAGASISNREKKGWSFPENIAIKGFKNLADHVEFSLSNDGRALLMTIEKEDAIGGRDIYVSFKEGEGKWGEPLNLGKDVNSCGDETSPFLASDGKTLYFATNGRSTFGSHDVFMSKRLDSTWTSWSEPVNLGSGINTSGFDAYYTIPAAGDYAYFVSSHNSIGEDDIFRIKLPKEVQPDPVVLVYGTVYNKKNDKPVGDANILYEILPGGEEAGIARSDPKEGTYKIVLPYGKQYGFLALAEGFISVSDNLDLTEIAEYKEIQKDLYLAPIEVGEIVRLNNIFFDYDKATLRPESFPELDRVVQFLESNAKVEIELSGHTDNRGSDQYNLTLSQNRAKAVVDYLIDKGISKDRIIAKGYGESKPVATNDTDEGRQLNRRVEFEILKK